ncbi:hypothetical protein C1X45_21385 [Pseudomonas sp. GW460-7]|nr:hypothetical protein C1X45_21385 [Pseudomonas sp. GW460-7]
MGNSCFIVELGCFSSSESVSYIQFANYRLCRWKWISWTLKPSGGQFIFNGLRQLAGLGLIFLLQRLGGGFNGIEILVINRYSVPVWTRCDNV